MSRRLTTEEFIKRAKEVHGNKYDYSKSKYINMQTKLTIICPKHGEFLQTPANHLKDHGCKKCMGDLLREKYSLQFNEFVDKANKLYNNKYIYIKDTYVNQTTEMKIICPIHGVFYRKPVNHLHNKSHCPHCHSRTINTTRKKRTKEEFIKDSKEIHGDKYDYRLVEYVNSAIKVKIICEQHGIFEQTPSAHIRGNGCPYCSNGGAISKTTEQFVKDAKLIHNDKYVYDKVKYINNRTKVRIICPKHGEFLRRPTDHLKGAGCPRCSPISKPEEKLYELLCDKFGNEAIIRQYKEFRYPFKCDFYIKNRDIFIELNASWVHGDHFFDETNTEDITKFNLLKEKSKFHSYYRSALKTWTERDLLKLKTAKKNKLNYYVFWDKNLTDAKEWLESI